MKEKIIDALIEKGLAFSIVVGALFLVLTAVTFYNVLTGISLIGISLIIGGLAGLMLFASSEIVKMRLKTLQKGNKEVQATIGINKLTKLPLILGGWAITGQFLENLVHEIYLREPRLIFECGSGTSTLVSAACLKNIGKGGKVISLDHEEDFADKTRKLLDVEGTSGFANVATAPLKKVTINGNGWNWYSADFDNIIQEPIDILVVDGPPNELQSLSRYPAVPLLKKHLAKDCLILLDDGLRADETEIAQRWARELNADLQLDDTGRGFWRIQRRD